MCRWKPLSNVCISKREVSSAWLLSHGGRHHTTWSYQATAVFIFLLLTSLLGGCTVPPGLQYLKLHRPALSYVTVYERNSYGRYHEKKSADGKTRSVFSGGKQERRVAGPSHASSFATPRHQLPIPADLRYRRTASFSALSLLSGPWSITRGCRGRQQPCCAFPYNSLLGEGEKVPAIF